MARFNASHDQYSETPNFAGVNAGSTFAVVSATMNSCSAGGNGSPAPVVNNLTPVQHNYSRDPLPQTCWITSWFDATSLTGAHHAEDVVFANSANNGGAVTGYGTPVTAMEAGLVVAAQSGQPNAPYPACKSTTPRPPGDYVKIQADVDGATTLYFHMTPMVSVGARVSAGQQIGVLDSSGCQSGPHLHVGRKDPSGNTVNFTIRCVAPTPTTKLEDGTIDDNDPEL